MKNKIDIIVILLDKTAHKKALELINFLKRSGLNVDFDDSEKDRYEKKELAIKKGIKFLSAVGKEEVERNKFCLRNLETDEKIRDLSLGEFLENLKKIYE